MATQTEDIELDKAGKVSCGVFLPVPFHYARLFPDKRHEDDSVPHFTLLYVGDTTPEQHDAVVKAVQEVARDWQPFQMNMLAYGEFQNASGQTIPHMAGSAVLHRPGEDGLPIYRGLNSLHADLFAAVERAGVPVGHNYGPLGVVPFEQRPDAFKAHATLAYLAPGEVYDGPRPAGSWTVRDIEVWGHERYQIPLGRTVADQPVCEDKIKGGVADDSKPSDFNAHELRLGVAHERGHSKDKRIAREIAMDHLKGNPRYYSKLKRCRVEDAGADDEWIEESAFSPPKEVKKKLYPEIEKIAGKLAGKELSLIFPTWSQKGFDASFKEGGFFKLRPKSDGVVLAKFEGLPQKDSRFLGVGTSIPTAMNSMKPRLPKDKDPEKEKTGSPSPIPTAGHSPSPKSPTPPTAPHTPVSQPEVKPVSEPGKPSAEKKPPKLPKATEKSAPGPKREVIGKVALHNDVGLDQKTYDKYAYALADATDLLKKRGFGFMLGKFTMHLRKGKHGVLGNFTGAQYKVQNPEVEIFTNNFGTDPNPIDIMLTMVHEMGHHYYYKEVPRGMRKKYEWYFKKAHATKGDFPSSYGATERFEDFAEIFAAFIGRGSKFHGKMMKHKLTPDIMQRFRTFLADDKRIDLRSEEKDSLFGRIVGDRSSLFERVVRLGV